MLSCILLHQLDHFAIPAIGYYRPLNACQSLILRYNNTVIKKLTCANKSVSSVTLTVAEKSFYQLISDRILEMTAFFIVQMFWHVHLMFSTSI